MDLGVLVRQRRDQSGLPEPRQADFIAFDVETASSTSRASICSIGVAVVEQGVVVAVGSSLVNPECEFDHYNMVVNGIEPEAVEDAPTMPELWPRLRALLDGQRLVAHYASFDVGALRATAARYSLDGPSVELYCTYRLGRRVWPTFPSHGLGYLGPELGLEFDHHEAGDDARATAEIALLACKESGVDSITDLTAAFELTPGHLTADSYVPIRLSSASASLQTSLHAREGDPDADPTHPLCGKTLCFTGAMYAMTRSQAADEIVRVGANFKTAVSKKIDYLVIGDADYVAFADGWQTGKLKRALELREEGAFVEIIAERDFVKLLLS